MSNIHNLQESRSLYNKNFQVINIKYFLKYFKIKIHQSFHPFISLTNYITHHPPPHQQKCYHFKSLPSNQSIQFTYKLMCTNSFNHSHIRPHNHMPFSFSNIHISQNHTYIFGIDIGIGIQQNFHHFSLPIVGCIMKWSL